MTVLKDGASYAELEIEDTMIAAIDSADAVVSDTEYGPVQATAIRLLSEGRTKITVHYYDADGFEIGSGTEISLTVYPESVK